MRRRLIPQHADLKHLPDLPRCTCGEPINVFIMDRPNVVCFACSFAALNKMVRAMYNHHNLTERRKDNRRTQHRKDSGRRIIDDL